MIKKTIIDSLSSFNIKFFFVMVINEINHKQLNFKI